MEEDGSRGCLLLMASATVDAEGVSDGRVKFRGKEQKFKIEIRMDVGWTKLGPGVAVLKCEQLFEKPESVDRGGTIALLRLQ